MRSEITIRLYVGVLALYVSDSAGFLPLMNGSARNKVTHLDSSDSDSDQRSTKVNQVTS